MVGVIRHHHLGNAENDFQNLALGKAGVEKSLHFVINTASEISVHDSKVNEIVTNGLREFEAFFRRSIEAGQARGEIQAGLEPETSTANNCG